MHGYPRPAPAFRWYSWWWPMGLINAEEDDWEVIEAEDAAIAAAEAGPKPEPGDLTALMEALRGSEEPPRVAEPDRGDGRGEA